jgi:hypothetical protein
MSLKRMDEAAQRVVGEALARALFERTAVAAPDPDGEHVWVLLSPPKGKNRVH